MVFSGNCLSHFLHWYGLTPLWMKRWQLRLPFSENCILHRWHNDIDIAEQVMVGINMNMLLYCYNVVNFLQNPHNRHPIAYLWGRDMGCLMWVQSLTYVQLPWDDSFGYIQIPLIWFLHCGCEHNRLNFSWKLLIAHFYLIWFLSSMDASKDAKMTG